MKAEDFDKKFDEGAEDIIEDIDLSQIKRPGYEQKLVHVDCSLYRNQPTGKPYQPRSTTPTADSVDK